MNKYTAVHSSVQLSSSILQHLTLHTNLQHLTLPIILQHPTLPTNLQHLTLPTILQHLTLPTILQHLTLPTILQHLTLPIILQHPTLPTNFQHLTLPTILPPYKRLRMTAKNWNIMLSSGYVNTKQRSAVRHELKHSVYCNASRLNVYLCCDSF
jgi:hypothetical protein